MTDHPPYCYATQHDALTDAAPLLNTGRWVLIYSPDLTNFPAHPWLVKVK